MQLQIMFNSVNQNMTRRLLDSNQYTLLPGFWHAAAKALLHIDPNTGMLWDFALLRLVAVAPRPQDRLANWGLEREAPFWIWLLLMKCRSYSTWSYYCWLDCPNLWLVVMQGRLWLSWFPAFGWPINNWNHCKVSSKNIWTLFCDATE